MKILKLEEENFTNKLGTKCTQHDVQDKFENKSSQKPIHYQMFNNNLSSE